MVPSLVATMLCFTAACGHDDPPQKPPPEVRPPTRGAAGDTDLRVMLAEMASSKACEMMKGSFRGLKATNDPSKVSGLLWIRDCQIENDGTNVTFNLGGEGWQWAEQTQKKAGGTFELKDYVKFDVSAKIHGPLDIAYDRNDHVVSLWFSPSKAPDVKFTPLGKVDVDEKGTWSNIVGGLSTVFGSSPDSQGKTQAKKQGTGELQQQLAEGMTVAIDLCTGYQRMTIGRPDKGDLGPPKPGESHNVPVEIAPNGMLAFGPFMAPDGMTVDVHSDGPIRVGLACADQVEPAVVAFVHDQPLPEIKTLENKDIDGSGTLKVKPQRCKVAFVVKSLAEKKVSFDWVRPPREIAQSTGGPAIHCARKSTLSSASPNAAAGSGAAPPAAARRR